MSRKDAIKLLRSQLVHRRNAIRALLSGDAAALSLILDRSSDLGDYASELARGELTSHMMETESRELEQIDGALARFNNADFGDCEECSQPIPLARLRVLPYATLCIECQRMFEKSQPNHWSGSMRHA